MDNKEEARVTPTNPPKGLVQVNRRVITWTPSGLPVPTSVPALTRQGVEELAITALSLPYEVTPVDPELYEPLGPDATPAQRAQREKELRLAEREHAKDLEFQGMTNAEVVAVKMARMAAAGDKEAIKELWDRTLGRPKQSVESKSVNMTYEDVLKEMARRGESSVAPLPEGIVDVEAVEAAEHAPPDPQRSDPDGGGDEPLGGLL